MRIEKFLAPKKVYITGIIYFVLTTLLKWRFHPDITILLYFAGAAIGIHLLSIIEYFINQNPSPFRNVLTQGIISILTLFIVSSSINRLGQGVVLFLNLRLFYDQYMMYKSGGIGEWFKVFDVADTGKTGRYYLIALFILLFVETGLFILV